MQLSEKGECADWGIGWHSDLSLHNHSICDQSAMGLEQLGSTEHSDSHHPRFGNCLGAESPNVVE
jgi:hypothetical protein